MPHIGIMHKFFFRTIQRDIKFNRQSNVTWISSFPCKNGQVSSVTSKLITILLLKKLCLLLEAKVGNICFKIIASHPYFVTSSVCTFLFSTSQFVQLKCYYGKKRSSVYIRKVLLKYVGNSVFKKRLIIRYAILLYFHLHGLSGELTLIKAVYVLWLGFFFFRLFTLSDS